MGLGYTFYIIIDNHSRKATYHTEWKKIWCLLPFLWIFNNFPLKNCDCGLQINKEIEIEVEKLNQKQIDKKNLVR
jgi:hypothetical protein